MRKFFYWRYGLPIYIILITAFNYILLQFPLTNVFGYEFSAFNSILLCLLSGLHTLSMLNGINKENRPDRFSGLRINFLIFLAIPFLISVINSFFNGFCSFTDGLLFYIVLTMPSVIIGSGLAFISFKLIPGLRIFLFILSYVLLLLLALIEIYFNHQVYLFNPIFGYFPGTVFDEGLSVDWKLIIYRFLNLIFFTWALMSIANHILDSSVRRKLFPYIVLLVAGFFYFLSPYFGFSTPDSRIKYELSYKLQSKNFTVYSSGKVSKKLLKYVALSCENYYSDLSKYFQEKLSDQITIFLFDSPQQQKEIFGSENADVAKPWLKSIYTSVENWEYTIKHEIGHCLSAHFGTGPFKVAGGYNAALIEGIAEAGDAFYDENSIQSLASTAFNNGFGVDIAELFKGLGFFNRPSTLSYVYAGSFSKYLIDKYGIIKFKQFYSSNDFKETYNIPINQIIPQYNEFLKSLGRQKNPAKAQYYFGKQSLFEKVCPRYISGELERGWDCLRKGEIRKASEIFIGVLEKTPDFNALIGLAESYEKMGSIKNSVAVLEKNKNLFNGTNNQYNLAFILANYFAKTGNLKRADSLYSSLEFEKPNKSLQLLSALRSDLIRDRNIGVYLRGSDFDKYHILKKLNSPYYIYSTFPALIELSETLDENYSFFADQFDFYSLTDGKYSSYALLKLSRYMMKHLDFENARRIALLAVRYRNDSEEFLLLDTNLKKATWFQENENKIISSLKFSYAGTE